MTQIDPSEFSIAGYAALVRALIARGYMARGFAEAEPTARHLVLRHDIDMSIEAAVPIAEAEAALGVAATYFVLMRSELYNPFAPSGAAALVRIASLGHEIGLHFDAALYPEAALEDAAARECAMLETFMERRVRIISFHRPHPSLLGRAGMLAGRRHAYEPRFFRDMGYRSDSRGGWRHGHPLAHEAVAEGRALQLLTHPIWWQDPPAAPIERLDALLDTRLDALDRALAAHCDVHVPGRRRNMR
ncbi:MAG: polysaccharide deacetylase family protein [Alphaproteobacteria bacterium]